MEGTLSCWDTRFLVYKNPPILRGRDIKRYGYNWANLWIINTHNGIKGKLARIEVNEYPAIKAHLDQYWDKISKRADKGDTPYNLRNCVYMDVLDQLFCFSLPPSGNWQGSRPSSRLK